MRWLMLVVTLFGCGPKSDPKSPKDENIMPPGNDAAAIERYNQALVFRKQSIDAQNQGDWQAARAALQECVSKLDNEPNCARELKDLESQHRF